MAKTREIYVCSGCGARSFQWHGQCPSCGEWNTLQPVAVRQGSPGSASPAKSSVSQRNSPQTLESVTCEGREPYPSGIAALDRVLGSGLVPGAAILLGGEPGIGKSTLLLQVAGSVSARGQKVLYASGEESLPQVRARAERLGLLNPRLMAMSTSSIEEVIAGMEVDIPERMVTCQLDGLMRDLEQQLMQQGATMDAYLEMAGVTRDDLRRQAESSARAAVEFELAMTEIARRENIQFTDAELEEKYTQMSALYGMTPDQLKQSLPIERLTHDLRLARARAIIVDSAKQI